MEYRDISPMSRASGTIQLPGSKSISTRTLLLAALARGVTTIKGLLISDDVEHMLKALTVLNIHWEKNEENGDFNVHGVDGILPVKNAHLFLGNAGIVFRSLTGVLALSRGQYTLSGHPRMFERPIGDLVDALRQLGANIRYLENDGYPPLSIERGNISHVDEISIKGNISSQFLSALLMALPLMEEETSVRVVGELISKPYVEMTLNMMKRFAIQVEQTENWTCFRLSKGQHYVSPGVVHVEGDASSASYFLAAGAIGGGPVRVEGVGRQSIQGDIRFVDILASMGTYVQMDVDWIETSSRVKLQAVDCDLNHIPDAAMTLAVVALFAEGTTKIRHIGSWRVKETDRLSAMATELRKVGAVVEEGADYIYITPPRCFPETVEIDTYDDHRMAMCFSLLALGGITVRINNPRCVTKTFPGYFETFASISNS